MFGLFCFLLYVGIGVLSAFAQQPWWFYKIFEGDEYEDLGVSIGLAIAVSGIFWPATPVIRLGFRLYESQSKKYLAQSER